MRMEAEGWRKEVIIVITSRHALIKSFLNFQPPASSFQQFKMIQDR